MTTAEIITLSFVGFILVIGLVVILFTPREITIARFTKTTKEITKR